MTETGTITIDATVNGRPVHATIAAQTTLLDFVREELGLRGAKRSCDVQVCGACTMLLDGTPVSSCCTLAWEAQGKAITTIEGLSAHGSLDPIQQAFVDTGAVQCGFCTSGMVLTAKSLLADNPSPSRDDITAYMSGNLCRCTGYWRIIDAIQLAGERMRDKDGGS
ncbi:MAG: (2Fe-2S)-binding protein [Thermomicrobiales bacterium]|nr:(2Fe-2S)-binding protein [Thermomicrobiales bacterium]